MARARLEAVDALRGLVMIVMALDHTRDFFGVPGQNPTDLTSASAALFLTRWLTHVCAPVFALLTGTGAYLASRRLARPALTRYLWTRGLWLIVLEVTVVRCLVYQFNVDYRVTMLLVLWSLGWSMIALAALVRLPLGAVTAVGVALVAGHNLLDGVRAAHPIWAVLHGPGFVLNTPAHAVFAAYPLLPWIGVTAVGFGLGRVYDWPAATRRTFLLRAGLALTAGFVLLRALNGYGDPAPWRAFPAPGSAALSFLNTTKYPPSLAFLMMTLGPALLLLRALDARLPRVLGGAVVLGRVPLFYYMAHFALIHALAVVVCLARYGTASWMLASPDVANYPFTAPPGWGVSLPVVYATWVAVVTAMFPLCRWFAALKQQRADAWLRYL